MPDLSGGEHAEAVKLRGDLQFRGDDIAGAALATYEEAFTAATRRRRGCSAGPARSR
jgi:hypothetical protein